MPAGFGSARANPLMLPRMSVADPACRRSRCHCIWPAFSGQSRFAGPIRKAHPAQPGECNDLLHAGARWVHRLSDLCRGITFTDWMSPHFSNRCGVAVSKTSNLPKHSNGKTGAPRSHPRTWDEKEGRSPTTAFTPPQTNQIDRDAGRTKQPNEQK
jgi:hypothetical protein